MEAEKTPDWVLKFLQMTAKYDLLDEFFLRCDGEWAPVTFFTNANDTFCWACADGEPVRSAEDVEMLERAILDCREAISDKSMVGQMKANTWGTVLYAGRKRMMRPQGAAYPQEKELWPLLDACGPEREVDFGNPSKPGEYGRGNVRVESLPTREGGSK